MVNMNVWWKNNSILFCSLLLLYYGRFYKISFESASYRDAASQLRVIQTLGVGLMSVCLCEAINRCSIMRFFLYFLEKVYFCIAIHIQNDIKNTNITH